MSDDISFEVMMGDLFDLKGNALIFSTKGEKNYRRTVVASRVCSNFPVSAIATKAGLEMWFNSPSPTIQDLIFPNEMSMIQNLGSHEDLIYAGDTFDTSLSRDCVERASNEYISCIETQLIHKIHLKEYVGFENLPGNEFLRIAFYNLLLPLNHAFKEKNHKRAIRIKREFSEITKGYQHPAHIEEIYNCLKKGNDELALNLVYQMTTIKNEDFELTALLKREHDAMKYKKRYKR